MRDRVGACQVVVWLVAALSVCATASAQTPQTHASGVNFASLFGTAFHKGDLSGSPWGVAGGATMSNGAGVGARWSRSDVVDYWSVGFLQIMPSIKGAKTVQPTASLALGRAIRRADVAKATCLEVGGGVDIFLAGPIGVGVDLRYLHGLTDLGVDKLRERYVSFALLWRF